MSTYAPIGGRLITKPMLILVLLFMLAFLPIQLGLRPFFPIQHDWGDFVYLMAFFALGYVLYADARFAQAIRKDGWIIGAAALVALALLLATFGLGDPFVWAETPAIPQFYLIWSLVTANAVYWTLFVLFVGMRFLDFSNAALRYGQEAVLPFFVVHQPVILAIAYFVVQWQTALMIKLLVVVLGSFAVSLGLTELVIKRVGLLRILFGMKSEPLVKAQVAVVAAR